MEARALTAREEVELIELFNDTESLDQEDADLLLIVDSDDSVNMSSEDEDNCISPYNYEGILEADDSDFEWDQVGGQQPDHQPADDHQPVDDHQPANDLPFVLQIINQDHAGRYGVLQGQYHVQFRQNFLQQVQQAPDPQQALIDGLNILYREIATRQITGLIDADQLGTTLTHEHLHSSCSEFYVPPSPIFASKPTESIKLENYGWLLQNPYSHKENMVYGRDTKDAIIEEMKFYKSNGGGTLVDVTTVGSSPNIPYLKEVAEATGVNIIAGTGFYVLRHQAESNKSLSVEAMAAHMRHELAEGHGDTGIKCGLIGEVGCSWPLEDFEKRSLRASAAVQSELGCPLNIHPGRDPEAPFEILRIFQEAGGKARNVALAHLDRTIFDKDQILEFAKLGAYCEYDLFGIETSSYQLAPELDMPSDAQRIQIIKTLVNNGYGDKVLVAHDLHTRHRLMRFGGHGFSHILLHVAPKMLQRGISQESVNKILVENPKRWLTYL